MKFQKGMTLLETVIAMAIMVLIAGALITMSVTTLSAQQSAKLKNLATRCAEAEIENIKNLERQNRARIQDNNWDWLVLTTPDCDYTAGDGFFKKTLTLNDIVNGREISLKVDWLEKGRPIAVELTTRIYVWQ